MTQNVNIRTFNQIFNDADLPMACQPFPGDVSGNDLCIDLFEIPAPASANWTNESAKWWCAVWHCGGALQPAQ